NIYAESNDPDERDKGKDSLKKVKQHNARDIDSWIQLAEILEGVDSQDMKTVYLYSLDAYMTTSKLIHQFHGKDIPIEMFNNMDSLYYRLNNYEESPHQVEPAYANSILITMHYNSARVCEASFEFNKTETLYKENLREHFKYVDCVIHLGSMVHDRGQIYSASDWFNDALEINHNSPTCDKERVRFI
ncbi:unnamed protein product, partial [Rotaria sp. Silwood1]